MMMITKAHHLTIMKIATPLRKKPITDLELGVIEAGAEAGLIAERVPLLNKLKCHPLRGPLYPIRSSLPNKRRV
jgi:hypothetical protein